MANEPTSTDINALLDDLDAGIFRQKVGDALSAVAAGIVATGKAGKVTVTFDMKQIECPPSQLHPQGQQDRTHTKR